MTFKIKFYLILHGKFSRFLYIISKHSLNFKDTIATSAFDRNDFTNNIFFSSNCLRKKTKNHSLSSILTEL